MVSLPLVVHAALPSQPHGYEHRHDTSLHPTLPRSPGMSCTVLQVSIRPELCSCLESPPQCGTLVGFACTTSNQCVGLRGMSDPTGQNQGKCPPCAPFPLPHISDRRIGRFVRLVCRAKKPLGEGAPAYGGRQSTIMQRDNSRRDSSCWGVYEPPQRHWHR